MNVCVCLSFLSKISKQIFKKSTFRRYGDGQCCQPVGNKQYQGVLLCKRALVSQGASFYLFFLLLLIFLSKSYADVFLCFFVKVPILSCLKLNFLRLPRKDDIKFRVSHFFFVLFSFSYRFTSSERVSVFDRGVVERLFGKF